MTFASGILGVDSSRANRYRHSLVLVYLASLGWTPTRRCP